MTIDDILSAIRLYVKESRTEYSVMISGEWGIGKTYIWKNVIVDDIEKSYFSSEKKPVYVSLYGVETKNEIDNLITQNALSLLRFTITRYIYGLFFFLTKNYIDTEYLHKILRKKNIVLCVDDLERANMSISAVLGYLNRLVEHEKIKIIILCNESGVRENDEYIKCKEKVVGFTYKYVPDVNEIVLKLIAKCKNNKIISMCSNSISRYIAESNCTNIRTYQRGLQICDDVLEHVNNPDGKLCNDIVYLSLLLVDEFRSNRIGNDYIEQLLDNRLNSISLRLREKADELIYIRKLVDKHYCGNSELVPKFKSIYILVTKGFLDVNSFLDEIGKYNDTKLDKIPSKREMFFGEFWKLNDEDVNKLANDILQEIKNNTITDLNDILRIAQRMFFFSREGIIRISPDDLQHKFITSLNNEHLINLVTWKKLNLSNPGTTANDLEMDEYKEVKSHVLQLAEMAEYNDNRVLSKHIIMVMLSNIDEFNRIVYEDNKYALTPIFCHVDIDLFMKKLLESDSDFVIQIEAFIKYKYHVGGVRRYLGSDLYNLKQIYERIMTELDANTYTGIKQYVIKLLADSILKTMPYLGESEDVSSIVSSN